MVKQSLKLKLVKHHWFTFSPSRNHWGREHLKLSFQLQVNHIVKILNKHKLINTNQQSHTNNHKTNTKQAKIKYETNIFFKTAPLDNLSSVFVPKLLEMWDIAINCHYNDTLIFPLRSVITSGQNASSFITSINIHRLYTI